MPRWLAESLGVSLAAQAATLPIVLVSFGRLAILSPVVNLLVVPLVAPAMAAGVVALAGGAIVVAGGPPVIGADPRGTWLGHPAHPRSPSSRRPRACHSRASRSDRRSTSLAAAAAALGLVAVTWWQRRRSGPRGARMLRRRPMPSARAGHRAQRPAGARPAAAAPSPVARAGRAAIVALIVALVVAGGVVAARPAGIARVSILDVGQGDAILVEGSRGGRLLVDGGPDPDRLLVVLDERIPPWDRRIDAVILTHPHEDHVAGLALLLARYHVGRVFEPGMIGPGPGYAAWQRTLSVVGSRHTRLARRRRPAVGRRDRIARPVADRAARSPSTPPDGGTGINNVSIVLLGQVGERRFLLMGDVEEGIDPSLLKDRLPHVDLLKVAHHGSKTATTQAFVDAVRPAVAVASAGTGNPYGHPAKSTLDRLAASGARVLRTDLDGTVVVGFEAGGMTVRAEGGRPSAARAPAPARPAGRASTIPATAATVTAAFLCAIPVTGLVPPPAVQAPAAGPPRPEPDRRVPSER